MRPAVFAAFLFASFPAEPDAQMRFSERAVFAGVADGGESNGAAFGDYSGDGLADLFVSRLGSGVEPLLYRNRGDGTFADDRAQVAGLGPTMGGVFVDCDVDGDLDLYTVHFLEPNRLLDNQEGRLVATDRAGKTGDFSHSMSAAFADFDGDGRVDLFTASRNFSPNQYYIWSDRDGFVERSEMHSALRSGRETFGAVPFDYDADGDVDLYVSSLGFANLLFSNEGRGTFRQVAQAVGLGDEKSTVLSLPGDYDADGDFDLYVVRARGDANSLYANDGGQFSEVAAGVSGATSSTGAAWADYDNDGDLDLLVSNIGATALYENAGDGTFVDISALALPAATQSAVLVTGGMAVADYDADGDIDAFLSGLGTADLLLRNDTPAARWLRVELVARPGQTALGSRVRVRDGAAVQLRAYSAATQVGTAHGDLLHFGVGSERVDVEVEWASGQRQILTAVAGQVLRVRERVPARDLHIDAVLEPDMAPRWKPMTFAVDIRNAGTEMVAGARLVGRVEMRGQLQYEQALAVPALRAGEVARLRFPEWLPQLGGAHRFEFALEVDGEVAANNRWSQTRVLHRFAEVAPDLGVADGGPGFAGAWTDFDRDGDLDLYVSNGGTSGAGVNVFYRNDGAAGFSEVAQMSGVADDGNGAGVVFTDFDRDGWEDLYLSKGGFTRSGEANRLLRNRGDGTFVDASEAAGLDAVMSSYSATVGDFDRDGYPDLYISQFRGQPNLLYHNDGNGGFEEVGQAKGIVSFFNHSGGAAAFGDYDLDGDVDLYASMFGTFDMFYSEIGQASFGVAQVGDAGHAVGMASGDYDNDGDVDIYIVNQNWRSALFRNDIEALVFVDVGAESGTENLAGGAGCAFGDYDADGDLDLFVVNGNAADRLYLNHGDGTFSDVAAAHGIADTSAAWSVVVGDYDADGDLDFYVINEGSANRLYQNGSADYNWLQVGLRGVESNAEAVGARLQLFADGQEWVREVNGTTGLSQSSRMVHFGLGLAEEVDSLLVHWPNGQRERFVDVPSNSRIALVEGGVLTAVVEETSSAPVAFALEENYPNPFNAETRIRFAIAQRGPVRLAVYNALGQQVRVLLGAERALGRYEAGWDGRDDRGEAVGSGVYFYRLQSGERELTRSMVLLR